jgi:hypothetical protein
MSAISAATIEYSAPFVAKIGDSLFTITKVTVPTTEEEYLEGGIELNPAKLGLTDGLIMGTAPAAGAHPELYGAIWCDGLLATDKTQYEEGKEVAEGFDAAITTINGKPFLRLYAQVTAGAGKPMTECKTATKVKVGKFSTVVFAIGK